MSEKKKSGCGGLTFFAVAALVSAIWYQAETAGTDNGQRSNAPRKDQAKPPVGEPEIPAPLRRPDRKPSRPDTIGFARLAHKRGLWPDLTTLTEPHTVPVMLDGEKAGTQTFGQGQTGEPLRARVDSRTLVMEIGGNRVEVPVSKTDFVDSANLVADARRRAAEAREQIAREAAADERAKKRKRAAAVERRKKLAEKQFSAWDGSHIALKRRLKNSLKDPGSLKIINTRHWAMPDKVVVKMTYRAKNSFGAFAIETIGAEYDYQGNLLRLHKR